MTQRVLILGGQGRIGSHVAEDILAHTQAAITVTGRRQHQDRTPLTWTKPERVQYLPLDLADQADVERAIADHELTIHCAGPFGYRDDHALQACIRQQKNYIDVADNPQYVQRAFTHREAAQAAGVTAIVSTGIFPGISNSMARQGIEQLDRADQVHLSYIVAGSGGAGVTVMRTTFLELQHPFKAWIDGEWRTIQPYSDREQVEFPAPYGQCGVYWFNTVEAMTLPAVFPVKTVVTKFGSLPDFYNHLTWLMAHWIPKPWLRSPKMVEFLAQVSYRMTEVTDRFSGIDIAMRVDITGEKDGRPARYCSTAAHGDTAIAAGYGTGAIAQLILAGELQTPGVWPVEQALSTELFEKTLKQRGLEIQQGFQLKAGNFS
ncbi:MAG: saccharopine dehydrogenase NADP-binding domain-containing protein [Leptolyngbyaceae cyanobacterium MO_188.B28]|nr:saccharopine dehydrogenase NADP-binding domain-containing protein [Leptolyngbyaceae cyanobacterium MO_188.B28]